MSDYKKYLVHVRFKFPPCGQSDQPLEVEALNKADAIKKARKEMKYNGYTRQDGPIYFTAKEITE